MDLLDIKAACEYFEHIVGKENIKLNEPMKNHTSFKLGGPADILIIPHTPKQLMDVLLYSKANGIPYFVIGNGTNLIVRDKGIRGAVIKIFDNYNELRVEGNMIEVEAGVLLSRLSKAALDHSLSGLEFAEGIPGTVGGAVTMNAGAYGGEMKDVVMKTQFIDADSRLQILTGEEHEFGYRTSYIQKNKGIVLKSWIKLVKSDKESIKTKMDDFQAKRKDKQPLEMPSAGSVFKRPQGYFAGKLIEDCGLRGFAIGGAQVSNKHCGFIVNNGDATTEDVLNLIKLIQNNIHNNFGVDMHTEVRIVGEE